MWLQMVVGWADGCDGQIEQVKTTIRRKKTTWLSDTIILVFDENRKYDLLILDPNIALMAIEKKEWTLLQSFGSIHM